jgi:site-specific DNA-methyltransferase (adenine-specific)
MKIVGATETAIVMYRDKLPKFNNNEKMIYNWFDWRRDDLKKYPKIHPTQKPVAMLKRLIEIFTDEGDTVIDPCAGSGTTLRACAEIGRNCYGFEVDKNFYKDAVEKMLTFNAEQNLFKVERKTPWQQKQILQDMFVEAYDAKSNLNPSNSTGLGRA